MSFTGSGVVVAEVVAVVGSGVVLVAVVVVKVVWRDGGR